MCTVRRENSSALGGIMIADSSTIRRLRLAVACALVVGVTACSSEQDAEGVESVAPGDVVTDSSPSASASASASASPSSSEPEEPSAPPATPSPSASGPATGTSASDEASDSVLTETAAGRELGLDDFFRPDTRWSEQLYDIARERDITGVGTTIGSCWAEGPALEVRLGNDFSTFSFKAGQSNLSRSSAETVTIQVNGNGNTLDIKRVPFNQIEEVLVDVSGVNALRIIATLDEELSACQGADIVLFNIKAE